MGRGQDPELLRRYLSVLAVNTAGIAAESTLWSAAGINAKTAQAYQALFQRMFERRLLGYRAIGYARDERPLEDDAGSGDATGDAETPATPISRKSRRRGGGRRLRKPSRAPW